MSLVVAARYLLEMSIWLRLLERDSNYGLLYYHQLFVAHQQHSRAMVDFLKHELKYCCQLSTPQCGDSDVQHIISPSDNIILVKGDPLASSEFNISGTNTYPPYSVYAGSGEVFGFDYVADQIRNNFLPKATHRSQESWSRRYRFDEAMPTVVNLYPKDAKGNASWNWHQQAKDVGLEDESNFVYGYTSRLLHAIPFSITANDIDLDHAETLMFLGYIDHKIREMAGLTQKYADDDANRKT